MSYNRHAALRKIHILGKQRGLDHEELTAICASLYQVKSMSDLSDYQLSHFIEHLLGAASGPAPIKNAASKQQLWLIGQLEQQLGWHTNRLRLEGFIARQAHGKRRTSDLTIWEASRVIEGLKQVLERKAEPAEATQWTPPTNKQDAR